MTTADGDRRRQRIALVILLLGILGLAAFVAVGAMSGGSSETAEAPAAEPVAPVASAEPVETVILMAVNTPGDEFTTPVGEDLKVSSLAAKGSNGIIDVVGDAVGLYGGSLELGSCDRRQLVDYLDAHPNKAEAWADVQGITTEEIRSFVAALTPLVLRADTLVTNHGYADGAATTFTSVLQAGTAVLVDERGLPVVRCFCGNPLTAAPVLASGADYVGTKWKGFEPGSTVRVQSSSRVIEGFEVVDLGTDSLFTRPTGTEGGQDADTGQPAPAGIEGTPTDNGAPAGAPAAEPGPAPAGSAPAEASSPAEPAGPPAGEPVRLFEVSSIAGVSSGPQKPAIFTIETAAYITSIVTYHYLNEGSPPGTIALQSDDGTLYGPWQAAGSEGQGGVVDAYWTVTPNVVVPAGTYTIVDSNPATWSWALDTNQVGITSVDGIPMTGAG